MATSLTHPAEHIETIDTSRFECLDGHLIERPLGNADHSNVQDNLAFHLRPWVRGTGRRSGPEFSLDKQPGRRSDWLTPDYLVSFPGGFTLNSNKHALPPVYLAVEVLSPNQTVDEMKRKAEFYFAWGAQHAWIIDPGARVAVSYTNGAWTEVDESGTLVTSDFSLPLHLLFE